MDGARMRFPVELFAKDYNEFNNKCFHDLESSGEITISVHREKETESYTYVRLLDNSWVLAGIALGGTYT